MAKNQLVVVYDPEGKPSKHSRRNARDLVNGAGYTWKPGAQSTPATLAPFATAVPPTDKEPAQAVLDNTGHNPNRTVAAVLGNDVTDEDEVEITEDDVPVVLPGAGGDDASAEGADEVVVEDAAVIVEEAAAEEAPAARGRGRRKAAGAE